MVPVATSTACQEEIYMQGFCSILKTHTYSKALEKWEALNVEAQIFTYSNRLDIAFKGIESYDQHIDHINLSDHYPLVTTIGPPMEEVATSEEE